MKIIILSVLAVAMIGMMVPSIFADSLDDYWLCAIGEDYRGGCVPYDEEKHTIGISSTEMANYKVKSDGTLELTFVESNMDQKLQKFNNEVLHQELWDIYTSITPESILSQVYYFIIYTDDYGGNEVAAVIPSFDNLTKWDLSIDPVDLIPSNEKIDRLFYIPTMIHENAHMISLNSKQGDSDSLSFEELTKQNLLKKQRDCSPNYYSDLAGCLHDDSYLNKFFQRFWTDIYSEHEWWWEYNTLDEYYAATDDFYQKYQPQFLTEYAIDSPDEDFAESFMAFVLKDPSPNDNTIPNQKMMFFYEYSELVEMRDFIRNAIAEHERIKEWSHEASVFGQTWTVEHAPNSTAPGCEETNECFLPSTLTIAVGDTVIFANSLGIGNQGHTSTAGTPADDYKHAAWNSGLTWPGESYSVTIDEAGTYPYYCMMHPWRLGTIIVEESTTVAEPSENKIPEWVKNIFTWYSQGQISEDEVLNAIKFLVNEGIINLDE